MIHQGKVKMPFDIKYDIVYKGSFQKKFLVKVGILSQRGGGSSRLGQNSDFDRKSLLEAPLDSRSRYRVCTEIDKFISIFKAWRHIFESFFPFIIQDSSLKTEGPALNSEQQH